MTTLVVVGFVAILAMGTGAAWWLRGALVTLQAMVAAVRPRADQAPVGVSYAPIPEAAPMTPEVALQFWTQCRESRFWPVLAQLFQRDARMFLLQAKMQAEQGHGEAATFAAGQAHYAAQQAVLVEREAQAALARMRAAEAERQATAGLEEAAGWRHAR